jgi:hypothetical protein
LWHTKILFAQHFAVRSFYSWRFSSIAFIDRMCILKYQSDECSRNMLHTFQYNCRKKQKHSVCFITTFFVHCKIVTKTWFNFCTATLDSEKKHVNIMNYARELFFQVKFHKLFHFFSLFKKNFSFRKHKHCMSFCFMQFWQISLDLGKGGKERWKFSETANVLIVSISLCTLRIQNFWLMLWYSEL